MIAVLKSIRAPNISVPTKRCGLLQSNHPRFKITSYSATLKDLRETDEGTYSVSFGDNDITDIINLKVLGENNYQIWYSKKSIANVLYGINLF